MPQELRRLKCLLTRGLMGTADVWPDVQGGDRWVSQAAHILSNQDQHEALTVQRRLGGLLGAMTRTRLRLARLHRRWGTSGRSPVVPG